MMRMSARRMVIFAMLGSLMFATTFVMKALPNIHLLALLIIVTTRVYRAWALVPIYIYVFLEGVIQAFSPWWIPYLYIWTILWAAVMLLPRELTFAPVVIFCAMGFLHGALFGVMWAPVQAVLFGLDFDGVLAWIGAGLPFDITHGVGNAAACTLALPLIDIFERLERRSS